MPSWLWIVIGVACAGAVATAVVAAITAWNNAVRKYLERLLGRREEARAVRRAFDELIAQVRSSDAEKAAFADDPEALERHSVDELRDRARQLAEELNTIALPKKLVTAAETLADACDILAEEAGRVGDELIADEALEALEAIDLTRVDAAYAHADAEFATVCASCGVEDSASYAGGLYFG